MKLAFSLSITVLGLAALAPAQTPRLLKDINAVPIPTSSNPSPTARPERTWQGLQTYLRLSPKGGVTLLTATTPATGTELYVTNGTKAGTILLRDINPGEASSHPRYLCGTNDGKRAFFAATDGYLGIELWVTDGTKAGTRLVKDIQVGTEPSFPSEMVAFGKSSVIFGAYDSLTGGELYISDGTATGTKLLRDIRTGTSSSAPSYLCATRDRKKIFFAADNGSTGIELWVTNGTAGGTTLVKDIRPGGRGSYVNSPVSLGSSRIVFQSNDGSNGPEIWVSDGTSAGTRLIVNLYPGVQPGGSTRHAIALGNKVLFTGYSALMGRETYITDGTANGTYQLIDANPGPFSATMAYPHLDTSGTKVYWSTYAMSPLGATRYSGHRIYVTDGTRKGTKMFTPKDIGRYVRSLVEIRGKVYFEGYNLTPGTGSELCVSDGTVAGTKTLRDTLPGKARSLRHGMSSPRSVRFHPAQSEEASMKQWLHLRFFGLTSAKLNSTELNSSRDASS